MIEAHEREAHIQSARAAIGERRAAIHAEAALDHVGASENLRRLRPVHLLSAEAHEGHERLAGCLLAHAAETDAGAIARRIGMVPHRAALAAAGVGGVGRRGLSSLLIVSTPSLRAGRRGAE